MQTPRQLTPDQIDEVLARVLLVFAKRGRELHRLRDIQDPQGSALSSDEGTATASNEEEQRPQVQGLPARDLGK